MANGVMSILLQIWNLNGRKPRTTYELLSFMHVLSVPGKASIEVTKASVVSLKFLRVNKGKKNNRKMFKVLPLPLSRGNLYLNAGFKMLNK